jgi:hypothetical protein
MQNAFLLIIFFFSMNAPAQESSHYACLLERPLIFGASISAGYAGLLDAVPFTNPRFPMGSGASPSTRLAHQFFSKPEIINISEIVNTLPFRADGSRQLFHFWQTRPEDFASRTAIISLDAFYWPAGYAGASACPEIVDSVERVTRLAEEAQIPLILGTIPSEDPARVSPLLSESGAWFPPGPVCLNEINRALQVHCGESSSCYLIDINEVVADLNDPKRGIEYRGERYFSHLASEHSQRSPGADFSDFRFDGVHLNELGTQYMVELIESSLANGPSRCPN